MAALFDLWCGLLPRTRLFCWLGWRVYVRFLRVRSNRSSNERRWRNSGRLSTGSGEACARSPHQWICLV